MFAGEKRMRAGTEISAHVVNSSPLSTNTTPTSTPFAKLCRVRPPYQAMQDKNRTRLDWNPLEGAATNLRTLFGKQEIDGDRYSKMLAMHGFGREASFFPFFFFPWTQQFPLRCENKLCASPTQKRFSFCQHNFLCWIWSSPTTDTRAEWNSIISPASQSTSPPVLLLVYTRCEVETCYRKWNYIFNWESTHDSSLRSPPFGHRRNGEGSGRLWGGWLRILGGFLSVCSPAVSQHWEE